MDSKFIIINSEHIVKLFESQNSNDNVACFDSQNCEVWRIESYKYPNESCPVTNIYIQNEKLFVYRWCGIEEEIDTKTGKIIASELIK